MTRREPPRVPDAPAPAVRSRPQGRRPRYLLRRSAAPGALSSSPRLRFMSGPARPGTSESLFVVRAPAGPLASTPPRPSSPAASGWSSGSRCRRTGQPSTASAATTSPSTRRRGRVGSIHRRHVARRQSHNRQSPVGNVSLDMTETAVRRKNSPSPRRCRRRGIRRPRSGSRCRHRRCV